jgi:3-oxoacyl-[acyl-carrier-protein] synthase II
MSKSILVIDDDPSILKSLERLFKKEGYEVICASSGKEALEWIEKKDFNSVIVDIRMPDLDGIETVRKIKEIRHNQSKLDIPVMFITGYSDVVAIDKAKQYGQVLLKPFDLEEFLNRVKQQSAKRRVVITGLGIISPSGIGKNEFWEANIKGKSGISRINHFNTSNLECKIAGSIYNFEPTKFLDPLTVRKTDRFVHFGLTAAKLALIDSKLDLKKEDPKRIGTIIGSGLGGIIFHERQIELAYQKGFDRLNPLAVPKISPNAVPGHISIEFGFKGPNMAISTACASGTNAIGEAYRKIQNNEMDVAFAGGAEAPLTPVTFGAYCALRILSKRNDSPEEASRPFDRDRDGFVMSEGAAVLILELLEHALKRNAHIYAEIVGYATQSGAHHMVVPLGNGTDVAEVMRLAIDNAGLKPDDIDYINAHGTSTPLNDKAETRAVKIIFGDYAYKVPISSTKSMIGHSIGASGAIEAAVCCLTIENSIIPPTINYKNRDPDCDLDYVPNKARKAKIDIVLSNSFGFGSCNACIVLRKIYVNRT